MGSEMCIRDSIRTYDRGFEEMYQYAQELGVKYVRGRVSECSACLLYTLTLPTIYSV